MPKGRIPSELSRTFWRITAYLRKERHLPKLPSLVCCLIVSISVLPITKASITTEALRQLFLRHCLKQSKKCLRKNLVLVCKKCQTIFHLHNLLGAVSAEV